MSTANGFCDGSSNKYKNYVADISPNFALNEIYFLWLNEYNILLNTKWQHHLIVLFLFLQVSLRIDWKIIYLVAVEPSLHIHVDLYIIKCKLSWKKFIW